ncbi:enoyl-CoA hydratase/isomerase family protein [Desulfovibrio sp. OttesenSCG-928-O18]|nr:enoyl-CoA hydratase/isomerase family protein [Desulfovibrio sp. OttesenSCG-928-O18]
MEMILYEQRGFIGLLTINRPKALNAFNTQMVAELSECLEDIMVSDIRCLVVTGAGDKAFVAGADIAEMLPLDRQDAVNFSRRGNRAMDLLEDFPVPVIAAVNGYALGGGCELALSCDIRIASETAIFGLPEAGLGIIPGFGGIQRLARLVGPAKAKELIYTTKKIAAAAALSIGLVNAVVPAQDLMQTCLAMAEQIAANAPFAVRASKKVINSSLGMELEDSYGLEVLPFGDCFRTEDQRKAMRAFVEKRKPEPFTGT